MIQPFSEMLKNARTAKSWSQAEVCKAVSVVSSGKGRVAQSTLSAWERGVQLPFDSDRDLPFLAEALGLNLAGLLAALNRQQQAEMSSTAPEFLKGYLDDITSYLDTVGRANLSLWILGPAGIRAAERGSAGQPFREFWVRNVCDGLQYCFLWVLDLVNEHALEKFAVTLFDVDKAIDAELARHPLSPGQTLRKAEHFAVILSPHPGVDAKPDALHDRLSRNIETYEKLRIAPPPHNICHPISKMEWSVLRDLQLFWTSFASVVLYAPNDLKYDPAAHIILRDLRLTFRPDDSSPVAPPPIYWLEEGKVHRLRETIDRFKKLYVKDGYEADS